MLSFALNPKIETRLKDLQAHLVEAHGRIRDIPKREAHYLSHCALVSNVGASTRIENAVLTDSEIDWVDTLLSRDGKTTAFEDNKAFILDKLSKDRERSVEEVVGSRDVLTTVYAKAKELIPLTEVTVRGLHGDLLKYYPAAARYAGRYKDAPNRVIAKSHETGEERVVLEPAPPGVVTDTAMADLIAWYNNTIHEHPWPLAVVTELTFRFLAIHPFQDGNGRLGRALFLLALLQSNDKYLADVTPYIAVDRHIEQNKQQYYFVLHQCSEGIFRPDPSDYEYEPLLVFFLGIMVDALRDIDTYRDRYARLLQLSQTATTILENFRSSPSARLAVAELVEKAKLPRRTIQYALKTLVEQEFIQRLGRGAGSRYQLIF
jgi:Fic family protein